MVGLEACKCVCDYTSVVFLLFVCHREKENGVLPLIKMSGNTNLNLVHLFVS